MLKEFKQFAMQGNLVDMAVAFVMGAAFAAVSAAFIDGIVMPLVSSIAQVDFSQWKSVLKAAEVGADGKETAAEIAIKWGDFFSKVVNFLIIAFVMFMVVKGLNNMKKKEAEAPAAPAPPAEDIVLLTQIRDLLKR